MKLIQSILRGDMHFSAEEIEAEEQVVVGLIDEAPENIGEIEDDIQDEECLSDEVTEISDELIQVGDVQQSLEQLAEMLQMETKPLTGREYAMVMAAANSMLQRANLESETFSVEEGEMDQEHDRKSTANSIGDKAKAVGAAIVEAIKRIWGKMNEWWDLLFDLTTKTRKRLLALGSLIKSAPTNEFTCELPATYQQVMTDDFYVNFSKAYQQVMVDYVKQLGNLALAAGKKSKFILNVPQVPKLPGDASFGLAGQLLSFEKIRENCTFSPKGSIGGSGDPFTVKMGKSFAYNAVGQMVSMCDLLIRSKTDWKRVKDIVEKEMVKDAVSSSESANILRGVSVAYDIGPKNFLKYASKVMGMRAQAFNIITEKVRTPKEETTPPKGQLAIGHTA